MSESRGDVGAGDLFNEYQRQEKQRLLPDPRKQPNGNDPAEGQYNQIAWMDLQFIRNAEPAPRRADRAKIEC
ncbi:hypothetical protein HOY80DRAFT_952752 [Tuber brumale]|nr:hypothetical protein HOY80DRAFT_952752 [Tuber brumale]